MLARKLDQILVVDLECTCWKGSPPIGEIQEIIEVGLCVVNCDTLTRDVSKSFLVKPTESQIGSFCTELTSLTPNDVLDGMDFAETCRTLRSTYHGDNRLWGSWGDYDRRQFERQCKRRGVKYPFGATHLNIKNLFAIAYGLPHEYGMDKALQFVGIPLEGKHHRGVDDATNIAKLLCHLLQKIRNTV